MAVMVMMFKGGGGSKMELTPLEMKHTYWKPLTKKKDLSIVSKWNADVKKVETTAWNVNELIIKRENKVVAYTSVRNH